MRMGLRVPIRVPRTQKRTTEEPSSSVIGFAGQTFTPRLASSVAKSPAKQLPGFKLQKHGCLALRFF